MDGELVLFKPRHQCMDNDDSELEKRQTREYANERHSQYRTHLRSLKALPWCRCRDLGADGGIRRCRDEEEDEGVNADGAAALAAAPNNAEEEEDGMAAPNADGVPPTTTSASPPPPPLAPPPPPPPLPMAPGALALDQQSVNRALLFIFLPSSTWPTMTTEPIEVRLSTIK